MTLAPQSIIYNGGVSGQTSTQIKDRMVAATGHFGEKTIIWAGRNNFSDPTTVKADIATMVAQLTTPNYLVLAVLNGSATSERLGGTDYATITALNNDLAAIYGANYWDVREYLVSQYDPNNSQDVIDHADDTVPSSLRIDTIHLTTAGYTLVGNGIKSRLALT